MEPSCSQFWQFRQHGPVVLKLGRVDSLDSQISGTPFYEEALRLIDRLVLSVSLWVPITGSIIAGPDQRGSTGRDIRMCVEGVLRTVRIGSPSRDLTEAFGEWNNVFRPLQPVERQRRLAAHVRSAGR